jgi:hypothetical protein
MDCFYIDSVFDIYRTTDINGARKKNWLCLRKLKHFLRLKRILRNKRKNAELSARLNARFPGAAVRFTASTVKNKLVLFKGRWLGCHKVVFAPLFILSLPHS